VPFDYSLEKAAEMEFGAVLFEGNIDFYHNQLMHGDLLALTSSYAILHISKGNVKR
jgi:hypothetical protein